MRHGSARPRTGVRVRLLALLAAVAGLPSGDARADVPAPPPIQAYEARYQVSYRGLVGGQIAASLRPGPTADLWTYRTQAFPNMLGRLAISSAARERGTMELRADGVRPLAYDYDDGRSGKDKDIHLVFDWTSGRATGTYEGKAFDAALEAGLQDTASVQAAVMRELAAGREPSSFRIVTNGKVRDYRYWSEGKARLATPAGEFDTVVWANQRDGSSRITKVWYAPQLGYVPVQAEQFRDGRLEMQMRLLNLAR